MYICVSLPVNESYQTLVVYASLFYVGMIKLNFFFFWGGGGGGRGSLICLTVLVVKLLTDFEEFGSPVKEITLGVSVVILDGASVVQ